MASGRRRGTRTRVTVSAGCAGLLAVLALLCGCSRTDAAAEGRQQTPVEVLRRAPDALAVAGSSAVRTAMEMDSGGTRITVTGEGGFDYVTGMGELMLTLPVRQEEDTGLPVTEVFAPGELYMKNRGAGVPPDKWVRIDVTTVADGNLVTGGATDPLLAAELLRGVTSASEVNREEMNGKPVTHFRGVTDLGAAARAASGAVAEQLRAAVAGDRFPDPEVEFDAYVDEDGLLRRVSHHFGFAGQLSGGDEALVQVASTVDLYAFGRPVDVELPGDDEVYAGRVA
ncbi:hypothetical protein [Streptomyces sp. 7-21]|jgi:hypothetical protein|uniref:hypothetical protein n=1 Tax=Streptomyces sp. 7-21 TaxID=2802283 RepID=UPI00191DFA13|nr:hypothetical protein [Streptomyces sp. 7-21]MBL1068938.1 hypothetical protein [Streptomyces sp. 7-21]